MWKWKKDKGGTTSEAANECISVAAPLNGQCVNLNEVPDEAFADGHMGPGIAIIPSEGRLVAPFDGTVVHLIKSHHAVMIEHASGIQLLLHIGINTVGLKGRFFNPQVAIGDKITVGQTLIEFDLDAIISEGYSVITPLIVANAAEIGGSIELMYGPVHAGKETVMTVTS